MAAGRIAVKTFRLLSLTALLLLATRSSAYAQASIAGVVKDTSGAVLPGVTVEASSPALIEKTRSVITDGTGQYKIVDLRPGTYTVTFSLTGFNTVKREGIELSGTFVASISAEMKVGALEETITVTGQTPVVDVQSSRQQAIISKDVLDAIPTGRSHNQIVALIPGVMVAGQDVGGAAGIQTPGAGQIHGGTTQDGRLMSDGLNVGYNGGSANMWMSNAAAAQETVVTTSGGLGEAETGGIITNIIPREGSNVFKGSVFFSGANSSMASSNYTDALKAQGLRAPNTIQKVYDFNPMGGGRIIRDKLWFYATSRTVGANNYVAGMFVNKNAGNINAWVPDFDTSQQAVTDNRYITGTVRLTYQATAKNKFAVYFDDQDRCVTCTGGGTATTTIEATSRSHAVPSSVGQLTWQSPVTSRLLLEAGYGYYNQRWGARPRSDGTFNPLMINATEQSGSIPGLSFRQPGSYQHNWTGQQNWRASISYVTGAHNAKFGYYGIYDQPTTNSDNYTGFSNFQFNNGVANRFTQILTENRATLMKVTSFYAQDSWTRGRMTLQGGVRFDRGITEFTAGDRASLPTILPGRWLAAPITFSGNDLKGTDYKDVTPRMAMSYDLFGNGKTAFKVSLGRYPQALNGGSPLNPISRAATTATRSWTDSNRNFIPDCDFSTSGASNLTARGGDVCGALSNPAFGTGTLNSTFDRAAFNGWGVRPYEWDFSTSVQHEILPRVSLNVGYFRRWFGNFTVTDNRAVAPSDFDQFSVVAPVDSRLPGGGGNTVTGLYNVKPAKFSAIENYITLSRNYGNQYQRWNGVDATVNARLKNVVFQGGTSTGRDVTDNCEIKAQLPEISPTNPYCRVESNFLTQVKGLASYTIPRLDVNVAATFQSLPNFVATGQGVSTPGLAANMNVLASQTNLGRLFAGGNANSTVSVNLVQPGTLYGDRINQIDFRVAKILRYSRTRTQIGVDFYNMTNSSAVQTYNQTYVAGGSWLIPNSILQARFVKISAQFDF